MLPVSGMEHPHTRMPEIKLLMNTPNANFGQVKEIGKTLIFKVKQRSKPVTRAVRIEGIGRRSFMKTPRLAKTTAQQIQHIYQALDYEGLGPIYCDEGGDEFWEDRRGPCQKMGSVIAKALKMRLPPQGRSLYVGAGVPEIPPLLMEQLELNRTVCPFNLRQEEVKILNQAGGGSELSFCCGSAESATGTFDHLWIVSVLNDPEEFPNLSVLFSYGRADPLAFDTSAFIAERETGIRVFANCMAKLTRPGLLTTSVEELPWVEHWCNTNHRPYRIEEATYPTALVGDPICFIRIE